jgi:dolichol-phosphate mannosyltransferase
LTEKSLELAVVVPTYNERENVGELIARLGRVLDGIACEVIVVDDDSPDGTADAVRELARADRRIRIIQRVDRRGLSSACIEGMMATAAPAVAVIDADLQHDETLLPAMFAKLRAESLDLVVASRYIEGGGAEAFAKSRARLSEAGNAMSRLVSRTPLSDPMSGFFVIDRRFLDEVVRSLSAVGFKILLDIVASARRPVRIGELPYRFRPRLHGDSKLDVLVTVEYLQLLIHKLVGDLVPPRFVLFALVGGLGVLLHLVVLYAMLRWGRQPFAIAQTVATVVVMTTNFFLNNILTWRAYRLKGLDAFVGLLKFYAACAVGAFLNIRVASFAVEHGVPWYVGGFAGLVVGSVWNYAVTAATTWRRRTRKAPRPRT